MTNSQKSFLDLYRITASIFVLVGHCFSFYHVSIFQNETCFPYIQNIGVVMLFILSGFLTAYSLDNKISFSTEYSFSKFVGHKFARIQREYLPALFFVAIIDSVMLYFDSNSYDYRNNFNFYQFFGNLFFLQGTKINDLIIDKFQPFGTARPLWTLSIEWWFYLLYGYVFFLIKRQRKLSAPRIALLFLFIFMPFDYLISGRGGGLGLVFLLGVLSYYTYNMFSDNMLGILTLVSLYIIYGTIYKDAYRLSSFILLFLIFSSGLKASERIVISKRNELIKFLSEMTFMLYLTHYSVLYCLNRIGLSINHSLKLVLGIFLSLALSFCMYWIFVYRSILIKKESRQNKE